MLRWVDNTLNQITMYRLVLYYLIFLLVVAEMLSFAGILAYDPYALLFSVGFLLAVCALANWAFSRTFGVAANVESAYISALILALIITPISSLNDLWFLGWAGILAMASKYIVASKGKHLFNPVALAVAITYFTTNQSASWWVGNAPMLVAVLVGGLLIVRKLGRSDLVLSFMGTVLGTILIFSFFGGDGFFAALQSVLVYSPFFFFAFIILTEPLTTPPAHKQRIFYGALVGFLFTPQFHIGSFYTTPELAVLIGNIYSYIVSPKAKMVLRLKEKTRIAPDTYDFLFAAPRRFAFVPGQYMEWTLGHPYPDDRGNRRFFTLASAPTEHSLRLGIKFYQRSSTFKRAMLQMERGSEITASQLAGEFVLPDNPQQKCVFIAGGIGITPFRSMLKYLLDTRQRRDIVMFYANRSFDDIVYKDVLDRAQHELGIQVVYTVSDASTLPANWDGQVGRITPQMIKGSVSDYRRRVFYISGPRSMVDSFKDILQGLGVNKSQIKTDFFAGLT